MSIINCTPHPVSVYASNANPSDLTLLGTFPPSGFVMRLESYEQESRGTFRVPDTEIRFPVVTAQRFKTTIKWPTPEDVPQLSDPDCTILVSMPVGQFVAELNQDIPYHVAGPDTGPSAVVRDENGQIKGTTRFVYYRAKGSDVSRV